MRQRFVTTDKSFWVEAGDPACARKKIFHRQPIRTLTSNVGLIHD